MTDRPDRNALWHEAKRYDVHNVLGRVWQSVAEENAWQLEADQYHVGLYSGALDDHAITRASRRDFMYGPCTLPYNLCRSAVDTLVAKVAKHRPLPQVLANDGDWGDRHRAKKCTQFLEGQFAASKFFEKHAELVVRDAAIFSRGLLYVWHDGRGVIVERTYPWEVTADPWDAFYGDPRTVFRFRTMDRAVLVDRYARGGETDRLDGKLRDAILRAGKLDTRRAEEDSHTVDRAEVLEAWRRPNTPEGKDGRHVVIVSGATLLDEPWSHDFFPFARLYYSPPVTGYDGQGLVEQLEGYQYDLNLMTSSVSESYRLLGHTIILVPDNGGIHAKEFQNGLGQLLYHKPGGKPEIFQPEPIHQSVYQRQHDLFTDGLAHGGISGQSASATVDPGITAAVAMEKIDDLETDRHHPLGRRFEAFCLDGGRLMIAANQELAELNGDLAVKVPMRKGSLLKLSWGDVRLDEFELRVFATSMLPQQPAARAQALSDLWEKQVIDRTFYLQQMELADLQGEMDIELADKLLVDEQIEYLLEAPEKDERVSLMLPSPHVDLAWAFRRTKQRYCRAVLDRAPDWVLERLRLYLDAVKSEQDIAAEDEAKKAAAAQPVQSMNPQLAAPLPAQPAPPGMAA